jgi:UTP--glucose-1-phosphate uridylyltransferase
LEALVSRCAFTFVYQKEPRGLGDALLQTRDFVGNHSFIMLIPDQLARAVPPASLQLLLSQTPAATVCSTMIRLPKAEARFFPGARGFEFEAAQDSSTFKMGRMLSEAEMGEAYRNVDYEIRGFGRTLYPPEIFDYLGHDFTNPGTGEVDLTKTFEKLTETIAHRGLLLAGEFFDLGTFESYYRYLPRIWGEEF